LEDYPEQWVPDHVIQFAKGGPDTPENLPLIHKTCNKARLNYTERQLCDHSKLGIIAWQK
jgi:hypothetical protein